jgi:hypothetical protein
VANLLLQDALLEEDRESKRLLLYTHLQKIGWVWPSKGWGYDGSQGPITPTSRHIINNPNYCLEGVEPLQTKAALRAAVAVKLHNPAAEEADEPFHRADGILQIRKVDFEFLESDRVLVHVRPLLTPLPKTALCRSVLCAS